MNYEYVDYVLANYLASDIGQSESEAVRELSEAIENDQDFGSSFRSELEQALQDDQYSWKSALEDFDIMIAKDETAARDYVRRLLWDSLFAG